VIRDVLVDTGPLIALVDHRDRYHEWVRSQFDEILPPLQTCEAVLTEACFLAGRLPAGVPAVLGLFERGACALTLDLARNFDRVSGAIQKYGDVPMSLADACLVRMSELVPGCVVLTLDRHFRIYRRHQRQRIPLLMPPDV
jgi:predicted nucleic acid-binding protein